MDALVMIVAPIVLISSLVAAIVWSRHRTRLTRIDAAPYPQLVRLGRLTLFSRYAGAAVALVWIVAVTFLAPTWLVVAPAIAGTLVIASSTIGEVILFNAARNPGMAALQHRSVRDWLPRGLLVAAAIGLAVFGALIAAGWRLADPAGRAYTVSAWSGGELICQSESGPFFGSHYSAPAMIATAVCLIAAGVGAWIVASRPQNGADPVLAEWDGALRRSSMRAIVATVLGVLAANVLIATFLLNVPNPPSDNWCSTDLPLEFSGGSEWLGTVQHLATVAGYVALVTAVVAAVFVFSDATPDRGPAARPAPGEGRR